MAVTRSISAGASATSDAASLPDGTVDAELQVKADNSGTPAAGDVITVRVLSTLGDTDADPDVADEYTTPAHAVPVAVLDTYAEDPAVSAPIAIPASLKAIKLYAANGGASNAITVSAQMRSKDKDGNVTETQITWS